MDKPFQWFFMLVLWGFALYGTVWVYKQRSKLTRLRRAGLRTIGVITGHRFTGGDDGSYKAEVVFLTQEGKQQTETTTTHTPQQFPKGTKVAIWYDPANPTDCFVDTYIEQQAPAVIMAIVWLVVIGVSVLLLLRIPLEGSTT